MGDLSPSAPPDGVEDVLEMFEDLNDKEKEEFLERMKRIADGSSCKFN